MYSPSPAEPLMLAETMWWVHTPNRATFLIDGVTTEEVALSKARAILGNPSDEDCPWVAVTPCVSFAYRPGRDL